MAASEWQGKKSAKEEEQRNKVKNLRPTQLAVGSPGKGNKWKLTIDKIFDCLEAEDQRPLLVGPGGALGCKFSKKGGLLVLRLLLGPLEQLLLLRQLCSQPVALLRQPAALLLPDV